MRALKISLFFGYFLVLSGCASTGHRTNNRYQYLLQQSNNVQVHRLYHALGKYEALEKESWPHISYHRKIRSGDRSANIPLIRQRLIALGDLESAYSTSIDLYDPILERAVMHFQRRHGLRADGVIGLGSIEQLNITPQQRVREMVDSMQRWAKLPSKANDEYVQVNIPSYELNLVKDNMSMLKMRVIVGKPSWPTPTLSSRITTVVLNPAWNVPSSIIEKEIVHHMVRNPKYLEEERIRIFEDWKRDSREIHPSEISWVDYSGDKKIPFRFTQLPGAHNVLGEVKFLFPNNHSVYLHDTQAKSLFDRARRDFSHGCVRLGQPMALFYYLMQQRSSTPPEQALAHLGEKSSKYFSIKPIPIFITYITAWVDNTGGLQFRKDIYNRRVFLGHTPKLLQKMNDQLAG